MSESPDRIDRIIKELWRPQTERPELEIFALLDGARDQRIRKLLERGQLDFCSLFLGRLPPSLARAAPCLVNLSRGSRLTRELLEQGWGGSWGFFLRSDRILQDLRRHLRNFLRVRTEDGKKLFFRFYDPRVFRVYLPTCKWDELQTVFGPVEQYLVESPGGGALIEFSLGRGKLLERSQGLD